MAKKKTPWVVLDAVAKQMRCDRCGAHDPLSILEGKTVTHACAIMNAFTNAHRECPAPDTMQFKNGWVHLDGRTFAYIHTRITNTETDLTFQYLMADMKPLIDKVQDLYNRAIVTITMTALAPQRAKIINAATAKIDGKDYFTVTLKAMP